MKQFFEWYLGVVPAAPGQGTRWRWSLDPPWPPGWSPWAALLAGAILLTAVLFVYRRDAARLPGRTRWGLIGIRLCTLALVLLFLTRAAILIQRTGLPAVAILVDTSASMGLEDHYTDPNRDKQVRRLAGRRRPTRLNLAKALLTAGDGQLLRTIGERFQVRLYSFDQEVRVVGSTDETPSQLSKRIRALSASGPDTRPGPALRQVLDEYRGEPPAAVLVFTDGITSTSAADRLSTIIPTARRQSVPVFTIATGSRQPARDLHLLEPQLDEIAFVDDPVVIQVGLKAFGFVGRRVTIRMHRDDGTSLAEQTIDAGPDGETRQVELTWVPRQEGDHELTVEAVPLEGETDRVNNSHVRLVRVRREKIRVLLADGHPRWEFRYVKQLLGRDPGIALTSVLQDADPESSRDDQTAREHFPVDRDELFAFDVIILGDIDPGFLSRGIQQNLRDFVRSARGGLVLVAGPSHNPLSFRNTPLEDLVPADLATVRVPDPAASSGHWISRLTIEGFESTGLFRLRQNRDEASAIVAGLPALHWLLEIPRPRPGAVTLLECTDASSGPPRPAILLQRFGAGSVLFHATDDLWLWRFRDGQRLYARYWLQAVRLLGRARLLGQTRTAELTAGRSEYAPGEPTAFQLRFFSTTDVPVDGKPPVIRVQRRSGSSRDLTLAAVKGSLGLFSGSITNTSPGSYHAWVRSPSFSDAPPSVDYLVTAANREFQQRKVAFDELQFTARATQGRSFPIEQARHLDRVLPPGHPVPLAIDAPIRLWNRWELLLAFSVALATEWLWRRHSRLV
ncbi:MAG: hypothetical protein CMJ65_01470 [Planctomycetaceae bacterium]|jgi:hypothetical protein|nr:hypothetical protein [Planctomycetaceae bacterium]